MKRKRSLERTVGRPADAVIAGPSDGLMMTSEASRKPLKECGSGSYIVWADAGAIFQKLYWLKQ